MLDNFESLPGIIHELQDGGLQIAETNDAPVVLVLGTASKGVTGRKSPVVRPNESENSFGTQGTLIRGMYEALGGGSKNTHLLRIGAKSAILYGVGTDDQLTDPTSIETLLKDASAGDAYFIRYVSPASLGPNAVVGHVQIKNANGLLVYDNNPGGDLIDLGEVIVEGEFTGGTDIGNLVDPEDFVALTDLAQDEVDEVGFVAGAAVGGAEDFDLGHAGTVAGSHVVYVNGDEIAQSDFTIGFGTGTAGVDELQVTATLIAGDVVTVDYAYDAEPLYNLREGEDGLHMSKMELYEAYEEAYASLENDEIDVVLPMGIALDEKNLADGHTIILSSDQSLPAGRRYPKAGSLGDALGKLFKEEYQGETFYYWNTNSATPAVAGVFPVGVGSASATTKIDGSPLTAADFKEVNFAHQLANFCFSLSVNDNEVTGVVGVKGPKSYSAKDLSNWIGKEPTLNSAGQVIANGDGLLGNKFMAGTTARDKGFAATYSGNLPTGASFVTNADVIRDRNGHIIDIGKYISVCAMPLTFFNNTDTTGSGYQANMSAFYGGFYSSLPANSSPTNKTVTGVRAPFRISKTKLNSLAKFHYVAIKQKENDIKISDAPTAARNDSDFTRLTTMRIIGEVVDSVRAVSEPYIGEPNTAPARVSLETGITRELARLQELGFITRFEVKVSASVAQQIQGDATVELVIVPAFELRKITIITSLAKQ